VKSRTRQDEAPSTADVGGAWRGSHAEGVTYARYVVTVDASGALPAHSGLVPGAPMSALNGVQIRPLSDAESSTGGPMPSMSSAGGCSTSGGNVNGLFFAALTVLSLALRRRRALTR
jgi:uncharacterized protein (TIGR03382 family)